MVVALEIHVFTFPIQLSYLIDMELFQTSLALNSSQRTHWIDITADLQAIVSMSRLSEGVMTVSSMHTTAAVTINENGDPDVEHDFFAKLKLLVPYKESFYRHFEGNSDSHVKTSLVGITEQVHIREGRLILGTWQSVYFCEFDGPRSGRTLQISIIGQ